MAGQELRATGDFRVFEKTSPQSKAVFYAAGFEADTSIIVDLEAQPEVFNYDHKDQEFLPVQIDPGDGGSLVPTYMLKADLVQMFGAAA